MTKKKSARTGKTVRPLRFRNEAEEAAWWDAHPDFLAEQFEKARTAGRLARGLPKSKSVTIRIPLRDLQAAQHFAGKKGLPYQTYMKMLLHQALDKERVSTQ